MSNKVTASNPKVGGAVYIAPVGTALPTSADAALNAAFKSLGYISEDGLSNTNAPESENIKAWGGDIVLTIQESRDDTFTFKLIEALNADVLKAVYGSENVTVGNDDEITVSASNKAIEAASWVIDMILKDNTPKRIVIPSGTLSDVGDIVYKTNEAVGYDVTITAAVDASGNTHYEYIG